MNITEEWTVKDGIKVKAVWNPDKTKLISVELMESPPDFAVAANLIFEKTPKGYLNFSQIGEHNIEFTFDGTTKDLKAVELLGRDNG